MIAFSNQQDVEEAQGSIPSEVMKKLEEHDAEILKLLNLSVGENNPIQSRNQTHERLWFFTYGERVHRYQVPKTFENEIWLPKSSPLMKDKNRCKDLMDNVKGLGTNEIRDCTLFYIDAVKVSDEKNE